MSRFMRGAGLVIIAAALAGCSSSHPAGPSGGAGSEGDEDLPARPQLLAVKTAGDFEGYLSFGFGLAAQRPYHVSALTGPDRVVIDV